jgi:transposase
MPSKTARSPLKLGDEIKRDLEETARSQTAQHRDVMRARILLLYAGGSSFTDIARSVSTTRQTVYKWVDKALAMGPKAGLRDRYHRAREPVITDEAKAWVVSLACTKPKELGYAAELWTRASLAKHVREHARESGFPMLDHAAKATVQRILAEHPLHPEKVRYYLERRDPEFEPKMRQILMVYREVATLETQAGITVCVDEKPGLQAIANTAPDLPPVAGKHPSFGRDHEYKRMGTLSILAALDLHDGHVTARAERRHRSAEFILLLRDLDAYYPQGVNIRIVLDNHSSHLSRETQRYLATRPGRFEYVLTPKHGSWLNLAENLFGKMARTFLRHIRVSSWDELRRRVLLGIAEMNAQPVVFRWSKFDALQDSPESSTV